MSISEFILGEDGATSKALVPSVISSIVGGVLIVILSVSFSALIFSGELSSFIPRGINLMLMTSVIGGIVISLMSSYAGTIATPQDKIAPLLALMSSTIISALSSKTSPEVLFQTVCASIAVSTLLTALFLGLLGTFRLGTLIRFIPYPVVGGFLAGTGWLLVLGSLKTVTGIRVKWANLSEFIKPEMLFKWVPAFFFGILLFYGMRRYKHYLTMPILLLGGICAFYLAGITIGISLEEAQSAGWLLKLKASEAWKPEFIFSLTQADWKSAFLPIGTLGTIIMVSAVSLLLNASAIELQAKQEMNLDRELRVTGIANLAIGTMVGITAFHSLSITSLAMRMGGKSRLVGILSALVCLVAIFFSSSLLSFVPMPIIGGLLLFLGISLLFEWLYEGFSKFPKSDYFVVVLIVAIVGAVGYLEGVAVGILTAVILFAINYSRINVVKNTFTLTNYRSNVDRPKEHRKILKENGEKILILRLQGFIFFGTANGLLETVKKRLNDTSLEKLRFLVLDFKFVTGFDTSAAISMTKMNQLAIKNKFKIILTSVTPSMRTQLEKSGISESEEGCCLYFPSLDHGVEWCENQILESSGALIEYSRESFQQLLSELTASTNSVMSLYDYAEKIEAPKGHLLIRQGELAQELFFVESGEVSVFFQLENGKTVRIRKLGPGTIVGEIGMYLNIPRSASVVTEKDSVLYRLTSESVKRMEQTNPQLASLFHLFIAKILAERLNNTDKTLRAALE